MPRTIALISRVKLEVDLMGQQLTDIPGDVVRFVTTPVRALLKGERPIKATIEAAKKLPGDLADDLRGTGRQVTGKGIGEGLPKLR